MKTLDSIPLTSIIAVIVVLVGAVLCVFDDLAYEEYLTKTAYFLTGIGVVGIARSMAGKGNG